jgi:hypothetical protein
MQLPAATASRIDELLSEAASLLPNAGGRVVLDGRHPDETMVLGDAVGFARLGLAIAKGSVRPPVNSFGYPDALDLGGSEELITGIGPEVVPLRLVVDWPSVLRERSPAFETVRRIAAWALVCLAASFLLIGAWTVFRWFFPAT